MRTTVSPNSTVILRPATADDTTALRHLAQLDSAEMPSGSVLMAVVDGRPLAALSVDTGAVIADPFSRTIDLVAVLQERASRIRRASNCSGAGRPERLPAGSRRWLAMLLR